MDIHMNLFTELRDKFRNMITLLIYKKFCNS